VVTPPQLLPAPAVHPKQWEAKRIRRLLSLSKSKLKTVIGSPSQIGISAIWLKSQS
jgi:hypothetical protein